MKESRDLIRVVSRILLARVSTSWIKLLIVISGAHEYHWVKRNKRAVRSIPYHAVIVMVTVNSSCRISDLRRDSKCTRVVNNPCRPSCLPLLQSCCGFSSVRSSYGYNLKASSPTTLMGDGDDRSTVKMSQTFIINDCVLSVLDCFRVRWNVREIVQKCV